jgi:hypothetical protein
MLLNFFIMCPYTSSIFRKMSLECFILGW